MRNSLLGLACIVAVSSLACSGSGDDGARGAGGTAGSASVGGGGAGTASVGGGTAGTAPVGGGGGAMALDAPDNEQDLLAFIAAKQYMGWAKEADYHKSAGPHGDHVKVFYSPRAAAALSANAATFPAGAAAIKELSSGFSVYGYSFWVKVQDATDNGNGFFWYEIIHQGGGNDSIYGNARGSGDCVGCHSAGKDYDLSTEPFQ
ncbi:MAG TPA: hypothetical protein VHB79_37575 [Polyangiaceae bacterium]|nr:hypothetical protein [Polyangiaceae bacterium]